LLPFELASVLLLMALIGAVILARREFIPEITEAELRQPSLTLPERPRELVGAAPGSADRTLTTNPADQNR
jgi:NAD(P)H-quinone oxidoreductase subunit 6